MDSRRTVLVLAFGRTLAFRGRFLHLSGRVGFGVGVFGALRGLGFVWGGAMMLLGAGFGLGGGWSC